MQGGWWNLGCGRGDKWNVVKSVEKQIQVAVLSPVSRHCGSSIVLEVSRDVFHVPPDVSDIILLELVFHLLLEALLATSDLIFKILLHSLQFLLVPRPESLFLLVQQDLNFWGHPLFTMGCTWGGEGPSCGLSGQEGGGVMHC